MSDIPRKLHMDDTQDNPALSKIAFNVDVRLNGERIGRVTGYDMDAGTIERFVVDEHGCVMRDGDSDDLKRETLTGNVEVTWLKA